MYRGRIGSLRAAARRRSRLAVPAAAGPKRDGGSILERNARYAGGLAGRSRGLVRHLAPRPVATQDGLTEISHESVLKALVTEPTLPIEGKYQNLVGVVNMLHIYAPGELIGYNREHVILFGTGILGTEVKVA